ncbi:MAG: hypothetical protein GY898_15380 [Proteobacteria bacterium]|nr:hypothetical protein [Pseudomonadota bacterium]
MRFSPALLLFALASAMVALAGCPSQVCEPGATQTCACPAGLEGVQTCRDAGDAWGDCSCSGGDDDDATADDDDAADDDDDVVVDQDSLVSATGTFGWLVDPWEEPFPNCYLYWAVTPGDGLAVGGCEGCTAHMMLDFTFLETTCTDGPEVEHVDFTDVEVGIVSDSALRYRHDLNAWSGWMAGATVEASFVGETLVGYGEIEYSVVEMLDISWAPE